MSAPDAPGDRADRATINSTLAQLMQYYHRGFIGSVRKHGIVALLLLGWVLSSPAAHALYKGSCWARVLATLALLAYGLAILFCTLRWRDASGSTYASLQANGFMNVAFFRPLLVTSGTAWAAILGLHLLIAAIIAYIWILGCPAAM